MPPHRGHDPLEPLDDGRFKLVLRQSTLESLDLCLERGRYRIYGLDEHRHTDATALGEAMHYGIEATLEKHLAGDWMDSTQAVEVAHEHLASLEYDYVQMKTDATIRKHVAAGVTLWHREVYPELEPVAVEHQFRHQLVENDDFVIDLSGTMDYVDAHTGIWDWKTSGRAYAQWEKQRWAIQPTVYSWAWHVADLEAGDTEFPFTYWVYLKSKDREHGHSQQLEVSRGPSDWDWLKQKCLAIAYQIKADFSPWPKNDSHALCSPKWCDVWAECKGASYDN